MLLLRVTGHFKVFGRIFGGRRHVDLISLRGGVRHDAGVDADVFRAVDEGLMTTMTHKIKETGLGFKSLAAQRDRVSRPM